jgi:hypothetical protein
MSEKYLTDFSSWISQTAQLLRKPFITLDGCFWEERYGFSDVPYISSHGFDVAYNRKVQNFFISFISKEARWQH